MGRIRIHRFNRAKIFQPFDALEGLRDALRAKEREMQEKKQWPPRYDEEQNARLDSTLASLRPGQPVCITFLWDGCLRQIRDTFKSVDTAYRSIVTGTHSIPCDAVLNIEMV